MEWIRKSYDATLIRCEEMPREIWKSKLVSLVQNLETTPEFQIRNNGYRRFPEVFVTEGVTGLFKGHAFSIWSDHPGEILLKHGSTQCRGTTL
jgi:hypothetical protein